MAPLETPARVAPSRNGKAEPPRWAGDEAVPHGLAVASAVTLRVVIVNGGIVLLGLIAKRMMVVVLPVIISLLLATLLAPLARWLGRRGLGPGLSALLAVLVALLVFIGLWGLVIPPFVAQVPDVIDNVQRGAGQVADAASPLGITADDVSALMEKGRDQLTGSALSGAVLIAQWAAAIVLIVVLTFFFIKDGEHLSEWTICLFARERRPVLRAIAERAWQALSAYVQGVFLVATIDAVLIGTVLLAVGVPIALPLIVLTFIAAFFPIVGAVTAGIAAVLVALVSKGLVAAAIILAAIVAVQQLEGNVFYPVVVGKRLRLHPVAILIALAAGGVLAGVAGAFLAIPVAAVVSAVLDYVRLHRAEERSAAVITT
jgi:predicted PurR-regulated permease PerM